MKHRTYTLLVSLALSASLLASCGPKQAPGGSSSLPDASQSQPDESLPDGSQPDESLPDGSLPDESLPQEVLTLNAEEIKLISNQGETFQLEFLVGTMVPLDFPVFTSSDEAVATVDATGLITAIGPGTATITADLDGLTAQCVVTCEDAEPEVKPLPEPKPEPKPDPKPDPAPDTPAASTVDLQSFAETTLGNYDFSAMMEVDSQGIDAYFSGLSSISLSQQVINQCIMSPSPVGDFALVQVSDSKDVDAVKAIFQARIDYMTGADGGQPGAWYSGPTEMWQNSSRIASNGDYIMLIVHEKCDDIVNDFNALF